MNQDKDWLTYQLDSVSSAAKHWPEWMKQDARKIRDSKEINVSRKDHNLAQDKRSDTMR